MARRSAQPSRRSTISNSIAKDPVRSERTGVAYERSLFETRAIARYAATAAPAPRPHGSFRWGQHRDSDPFVGATTRTPQPNYAVTFELEVP